VSLSLQEMYLLPELKKLHVLGNEACIYLMQAPRRSSTSRNLSDNRNGFEVPTGVKGTAGTLRDTLCKTARRKE